MSHMTEAQTMEAHAGAEAEVHAHPGERTYVRVAIILAVITAIEVMISYIAMPDWLKILLLVICAIIKFAMVVMWFMHLRFDNRLFTLAFTGGLALAVIVLSVVLTIQRVFFA